MENETNTFRFSSISIYMLCGTVNGAKYVVTKISEYPIEMVLATTGQESELMLYADANDGKIASKAFSHIYVARNCERSLILLWMSLSLSLSARVSRSPTLGIPALLTLHDVIISNYAVCDQGNRACYLQPIKHRLHFFALWFWTLASR